MKKKLILFLMIIFSFSLSSCRDWKPYDLEECESGYFKYHIYDEDGSDQTYVYLVGLTELGKQQKELIIPEYIDGLKVNGLGYERPVGGKLPIFGGMLAGDEVVYFDSEGYSGKIYLSTVCDGYFSKYYFKNLNAEFITWDEYVPAYYKVQNVVLGYNYHNNYFFNEDGTTYKLANVSYMYNYQNSPNDGYYWVDSYDNELITFIPPNPEREGYIFEGWYKEEECINKWDFNIDKTGKELIIEENSQYNEYPGIYLYAKWVKM